MFRSMPDVEPAPVVAYPADLIPLSHLELDLPAPATGWLIELDRRGIPVLTDDIGRSAIARDDARQLLDEQREAEARAREVVARAERQAVERDRQFRAQLNPGIPWFDLPPGATAAEVWAQAERDARPRRRSVLEDALEGTGSMEYHPIRGDEDQP